MMMYNCELVMYTYDKSESVTVKVEFESNLPLTLDKIKREAYTLASDIPIDSKYIIVGELNYKENKL